MRFATTAPPRALPPRLPRPVLVLAAGCIVGGVLVLSAGCVVGGVLSGLFVPADAHAQAVQFRHNFTEGADLRYEIVQSSSVPIPGMGDVSQEHTQTFRRQVLSVDADGNARIRHSIESIRLEVSGPTGNQSYDSAAGDPPADPALAAMAAMVGTSTEMVIGPDGSVQDAGDLRAWLASMMDGADPEVRAMLEPMLSDEALENMAAQSVQVLPTDPVRPGESWEHTISMPLPFGTLSSTTVYTLESVETRDGNQVAIVAISGTMGDLETDPSNPMTGMMTMRGGDLSGELQFDIARGAVLSSRVTTRMRMDVIGESIATTSRMEMRLLP